MDDARCEILPRAFLFGVRGGGGGEVRLRDRRSSMSGFSILARLFAFFFFRGGDEGRSFLSRGCEGTLLTAEVREKNLDGSVDDAAFCRCRCEWLARVVAFALGLLSD